MSDDLVNKMTLDCLISKDQLQKLNKKLKEDTNKKKSSLLIQWKDRIKQLFNDLLENNPPDDLLYEVTDAFENLIDKSVYYFESHDKTLILENERRDDCIQDDIDYDKEEKMIESGNYIERDSSNKDYEIKEENESTLYHDDNDNEYDNEYEDNNVPDNKSAIIYSDNSDEIDDDNHNHDNHNDNTNNASNATKMDHEPKIVRKKYYKKNQISNGVEDIHKLPLNWFQSVRQSYKQNEIIPRRKEVNSQSKIHTETKK